MDSRQRALYEWGQQWIGSPVIWEPIVGDASARRYFRTSFNGQHYLAVDSPPEAVDNSRFIALAQGLVKAGLHAPTVYAAELMQGFLLVDELSRDSYSDVLTLDNADRLYGDAMHALITLQNSRQFFNIPIHAWEPKDYYLEMTDMNQWLFDKHLRLTLTSTQQKALEKLFSDLLDNMQEQPQVCVHRDYHSRNLLFCLENNPGIIDFQDLFFGPITYDLVSLLRDAYIEWPWEKVESWIYQFYHALHEQSGFQKISEEQFTEWFHGMSLQRGIKVLGRFARLCHRDNKPRYLADLPRVARYVIQSCSHYKNTRVLEDLLGEQVMPALEESVK